jgi:hypothetical protein
MSEPSYTIAEFCTAERISRAHLYNLWKRGQGPRFYTLGNVRRITHQARLEFHEARAAETVEGGAR